MRGFAVIGTFIVAIVLLFFWTPWGSQHSIVSQISNDSNNKSERTAETKCSDGFVRKDDGNCYQNTQGNNPAPTATPGNSQGNNPGGQTGGTTGGTGGGGATRASISNLEIGPNAAVLQPRDMSDNCPPPNGAHVGPIDPSMASVEATSSQTGNCRVLFDSIPAGWAIEVDGSIVSLNNAPTVNSLLTVVPGPLTNYVVYCEDCKIIAAPIAVANGEACHMARVADDGRSGITLKHRQYDTSAC